MKQEGRRKREQGRGSREEGRGKRVKDFSFSIFPNVSCFIKINQSLAIKPLLNINHY